MSHADIIRAWKDEEYRLGLSGPERAALPENPAGLLDLTDADLDVAGARTERIMSLACCPGLTADTCFSWQSCCVYCWATIAWC